MGFSHLEKCFGMGARDSIRLQARVRVRTSGSRRRKRNQNSIASLSTSKISEHLARTTCSMRHGIIIYGRRIEGIGCLGRIVELGYFHILRIRIDDLKKKGS